MKWADLNRAVQATNQEFIQAFERADAAAMADVYTEDAEVLPPNMEMIAGKPAIQAFWQGALDMGLKGAQMETVELEADGDMAHEIGKYVLTLDNGHVADKGKYLVIWKREHNQWKWHRDMYNSSLPAPGAG